MTGKATDLLLNRFKASQNDTLFILPNGDNLTYGQVWAHAEHIAGQWAQDGAACGAPVALMLDNGAEFLCCYLACFIGGYTAVPINGELPQEDIDYILDLTQPGLVLDQPPQLNPSVAAGVMAPMRTDPGQTNAIFFTSGTTGRPKGVRHCLNALVGNVLAFNQMMGLGKDTRLYHVMPMAYMAGFLNTFLSPLMAGGSVVIGPRFSAQSAMGFWSLPGQLEAQTLWLSPSMAAALVRMTRNPEAAQHTARNFEQILCGTAPLHQAVRESFLETFGVHLQESYGTSELLLISAQSHLDAEQAENVGSVLPELTLDRRPFEGDESQPELVVKSPFSYLGYLTDEGELPPDQTSDGFVRTGDTGEILDGRLVITGRLKDIIIRGGVNIAPISIENELSKMAGITEVAVIGVSHPFWGEAICVCIEAPQSEDHEALVNKVKAHCREKLPKSHHPDRVEVFDAFPRAVTGKVQKGKLSERIGS